jgi:hypothetical protein
MEVGDFKRIIDHFRGICRIYYNETSKTGRCQCNRLDLKSLGSWPTIYICPKTSRVVNGRSFMGLSRYPPQAFALVGRRATPKKPELGLLRPWPNPPTMARPLHSWRPLVRITHIECTSFSKSKTQYTIYCIAWKLFAFEN